jgi:hypothetical protein
MVHTEIQTKNRKKYYYRAKVFRDKKKVKKERVYLGVDLTNKELKEKENAADLKLKVFESLLTKEELNFLNKLKKDF